MPRVTSLTLVLVQAGALAAAALQAGAHGSVAQHTGAHAAAAATPALRASADRFAMLDNGVVKLGVDMDRGGSIGWFGPSRSLVNHVNTHDFGREVQGSFYAGPAPYNPPGCNQPAPYAGFPWCVCSALRHTQLHRSATRTRSLPRSASALAAAR